MGELKPLHMDIPGQRGPAYAQLLHIWVHVVIPDEHFWGLVCSFLRDLTESISLLQVSCNHWWPLSSFSSDTETHKCPFIGNRSCVYQCALAVVVGAHSVPVCSFRPLVDLPLQVLGDRRGSVGAQSIQHPPLTALAIVLPQLCWTWLCLCPEANGRGKLKNYIFKCSRLKAIFIDFPSTQNKTKQLWVERDHIKNREFVSLDLLTITTVLAFFPFPFSLNFNQKYIPLPIENRVANPINYCSIWVEEPPGVRGWDSSVWRQWWKRFAARTEGMCQCQTWNAPQEIAASAGVIMIYFS